MRARHLDHFRQPRVDRCRARIVSTIVLRDAREARDVGSGLTTRSGMMTNVQGSEYIRDRGFGPVREGGDPPRLRDGGEYFLGVQQRVLLMILRSGSNPVDLRASVGRHTAIEQLSRKRQFDCR